ncbi:MAG: aldo/keto reductase [Saprospiraceae bacterium]|nr:aldo/keto reductase [Saprospiraceae bacterium]
MKNSNSKDRRDFLRSLAGLTAGIMVPAAACQGKAGEADTAQTKIAAVGVQEPKQEDRLGRLLPQRLFGKTGEYITMLGVGGAHIARMSEQEAEKVIEAAIEGGIRFFDNAEMYGKGLAEERFGMFLCPKYRDVSYIMSKSTAKTGRGIRAHLEGTLKRMKTDYLDLYQIHSISSPEDVDNRIAEGVLKEVLKAKEQGKVRHVGFTGHVSYTAHMRMLERTDTLQTCQMPINAFDPNYKSFINNVMPLLVEGNLGIIAMKTLSNGGFFGGTSHFEGGDKPKIIPNAISVEEALNFVWSLPVSVIVTGANDAEMLKEKIGLAKSFTSYGDEERQALIDKVANFDGKLVEYYKA